MIKRTLYFGNPAYLSLKDCQLVVRMPEIIKADLPELFETKTTRTIPIEDIGVVVLDNRQITITQGLLDALLENNCALITCDKSRMPVGLMLPLCGNTTQNERFRAQIDASLPLKKQLWQQTVQAKIKNQAALLHERGVVVSNMLIWSDKVKSGDSDNLEARAAAYYWKNIFPFIDDFTRGRDGIPPNNLLNYGYAILRAVIARALVSSGLLPTLGIHHHNRYNAYCLADDIMEPYRPYVDRLVLDIIFSGDDYTKLSVDVKSKLLSIPVIDVVINGERRPLMIAASITTSSLAKCFNGEIRKIIYPEL
ncbi:MAG: type II CRISPR-associated endonuclease Cas1 [Bacteroidales bacterium]|nr:type II CRISPR-associated endonuclease Cas1 [Bacteroidales bacterium]MBR4094482.1 type II CRISPR-associated endonuclease Cas1 [Bacteroidales bacterium]